MVAGHLREKNGYWHMVITYRDEMENRKERSFTTHLKAKGNRRRAEEMLFEKRRQITADLDMRRNAKGIYVDAYLMHWLERMQPTVSPTTFKAYSLIVRKSICPYFQKMNLPICDLAPKHIAAYYDSLLKRGLSTTTVRRHHANLHKALGCAVIDGLLPENPANRVVPPKVAPYTASYYSKVECQQLLAAIQGTDLELPVTLALLLGLRRSEVLGLKWESFDFHCHTVHISHTVNEITGGIVARDVTKRKSSHRTLPLSPAVEQLLMSRQRESGYICLNAHNELLKPSRLTSKFKALLRENNLREIRYHDLRHTCAALLIAARMPLIDVSRWLGHSSIAITADLYGHLEFISKEQCASILENSIFTKGNDANAI